MVNSGSTANLLMLAVLKWQKYATGNIIVPAVGWSTTYFPIIQNGFTPNFVDVDPNTFNIDVTKIKEACTPNMASTPAAIMTVNLCGNPCDYNEIYNLCDELDIKYLLEDNCESMGGKWHDARYLGTIGTMGSFSFYFSHHIQTMEGGMITTNDKDIADYLRSLRAHGWCRDLPDDNKIYKKTGDFFKDSFTFVTPGYSVRPLEMSGAIGSVQLKKFANILKYRQLNADYFQHLFANKSWIRIQKTTERGTSSNFAFACVLDGELKGRRDEVVKEFDSWGIEARPLGAGNFLEQPVMKRITHMTPADKCPVAQDIHRNGFWLGNHAYDIRQNIDEVYGILRNLV